MPDNVFPSRPGQSQLKSDEKALFLKLFSGEIVRTVENNNIMMGLHNVRTIPKGKGATFPVLGQLSANYHQVGTLIQGASAGSKLQQTERFIGVDNLLGAEVYMSDFDEAMQSMDMRGIYTDEMGKALSRELDNRALRTVVNSARQPATLQGINPATGAKYFGGARIALGTATIENLRECFIAAAQTFDEKNIEEINCILKPALYWLFFRTGAGTDPVSTLAAINKDVNGSGSLAAGKIYQYAGINILKSNNLPSSTIAYNDAKEGTATVNAGSGTENTRMPTQAESNAGVAAPSAYTGDFSNTRGVFFNRSAIGTVKLLDIRTQEDYQLERKATLVTSDYMMGHGILRPEAAIELTAGGTTGTVTQS